MEMPRHRDAVRRSAASRRMTLLLLSGLIVTATPIVSVCAQPVLQNRSVPANPHAAHIAEAAQRFGIPAAWIGAVMRVESANNVRAVSPKGAMGLMQIMPETWADLRRRHRLGTDPYNPRDNILAGTAYLREMRDRYGSLGFLAAYNAGPGRYEEHLAGRPLPAETRAYVAALRPIFGGVKLTPPVTIAAADPKTWARAPLFVAQPERTPAADPAQRGGARNDAPAAAIVRDVSANSPQSGGLFVVRNPAGEPR
ncbi:lytic transglycosylase domain-containing protein [Bosea lathyri]|uniref:Transglycosylase SLT domain-containing protein n=1 Tax=Bosea lathyri TaxID=1036778 RepID=A0A1H5XXF7_9HYPH|nr:lytic transglycosylase domain-containing protein [Bosea lathyri]SEG16489.1 Transglycosylase SLT domain-containing protein [Bosea lathyri]